MFEISSIQLKLLLLCFKHMHYYSVQCCTSVDEPHPMQAVHELPPETAQHLALAVTNVCTSGANASKVQ
jgi:hypothetical protein